MDLKWLKDIREFHGYLDIIGYKFHYKLCLVTDDNGLIVSNKRVLKLLDDFIESMGINKLDYKLFDCDTIESCHLKSIKHTILTAFGGGEKHRRHK